MEGLEIKNLTKKYLVDGHDFYALKDINLSIKKGSFTTIVGKSGCGKTTFLRLISGLEKASSGEINFVGYKDGNVKTSMIFQEARLLPWLTVAENIAFPVQKRRNQSEVQKKVAGYLQLLGLEKFKDAYPAQISGGMAQRVALGRSLIYESDLILMDEPLGALDAFNRRKLQRELIDIFSSSGQTVIFVTHDVEEAIYLGQELIIMEAGTIVDEIKIEIPYTEKEHSNHLFELKEKILAKLLA